MTGKDLTKLGDGIYILKNDKEDALLLSVKTAYIDGHKYGPNYFLDGTNIRIWPEGLSIIAEMQVKPLGFFKSDITSKMMDFNLRR